MSTVPVLRRTEVWAAIGYLCPPRRLDRDAISNKTTSQTRVDAPSRPSQASTVSPTACQAAYGYRPTFCNRASPCYHPRAPLGGDTKLPARCWRASERPVDDPEGGEETGNSTCGAHESRPRIWAGRGRGAVPLTGPRSAVRRPSVVAKIQPANKITLRNTMPVAQQVAKP